MITQDPILEKILAVKALADRGVDGEAEAAKLALDRLMRKYGLSDKDLDPSVTQPREFRYRFLWEKTLAIHLLDYWLGDGWRNRASLCRWARAIIALLNHEEWVLIDCSYEYFRRHAAEQLRKVKLDRKKIGYQKAARRMKSRRLEAGFEQDFIEAYCIRSGIFKEGQIESRPIKNHSESKREYLFGKIEPGKFHKQMMGGLMLEANNGQR